ncbi:hypothetical protein NIES267_39700 [Calothrix parasitica NIES-267]|uniref:Transposase n=1 Tax=Calothrix parasitica NIES-267 TaxID=1973488 RepID=A0A1Z4LSZ6_9CYAN|nr:hypothetical protein NIES267_38480 [Calothrix parasitica NIES-267]BAY84474.1 hypothetical protein NIES267_39700 [Calothrix parasitica NIES-267]
MSKDELRQTRIDNLKQAQASRKKDSLNRVNQAIKYLEKRNEKINFHTVALQANVSVAYLYKYPEIKQKIAQIRNTQSSMPREESKSTSSKSQTKILTRLKERIQLLESENKQLKRKNEALAGQVYRVHQLQELVERQNSTIQDLEKRLNARKLFNVKSSKVTPLKKKRSQKILIDDDQILSELSALNIKTNSTLSKLIQHTKKEVVLNAIDCLKEALATTQIKNPAGFLVKAIKNAWNKNEYAFSDIEPEIFRRWFAMAKSEGKVISSRFIEGILYVCTPEGELIPFEEMIHQYPYQMI